MLEGPPSSRQADALRSRQHSGDEVDPAHVSLVQGQRSSAAAETGGSDSLCPGAAGMNSDSVWGPHSPTLEDTALFMMSRASLNLSLTDGCASTWSENMDFQPRYHLVISS